MNEKNPYVSIVVPVYNVECYLRQCMDSLIHQTLKNIEIIIVNDGSTDNCPAICDEYAHNDKRIKLILQANGGYGKACNNGIDAATGEYIAVLEPDDFIAPDMYQKLYDLAVEHSTDIVKSSFYENLDMPNCKKIKKVGNYDETDSMFVIPDSIFTIFEHPEFLYFHPSIWSCIYKREFITKNNIRFVEAKGSGWTDNPFQVQAMCLAQKIFYTNEAFYYWRKVNANDSDALNDYTIPFKRSDEIHEWLDRNGIINEDVLACLYKREFAYIHIVFGMLTAKTLAHGLKLVKAMARRMDTNIIRGNRYITDWERKNLAVLKVFPTLLFFYLKIKKIKKYIKKIIKYGVLDE